MQFYTSTVQPNPNQTNSFSFNFIQFQSSSLWADKSSQFQFISLSDGSSSIPTIAFVDDHDDADDNDDGGNDGDGDADGNE